MNEQVINTEEIIEIVDSLRVVFQEFAIEEHPNADISIPEEDALCILGIITYFTKKCMTFNEANIDGCISDLLHNTFHADTQLSVEEIKYILQLFMKSF